MYLTRESYFAHFGKKGMRWGVRNDEAFGVASLSTFAQTKMVYTYPKKGADPRGPASQEAAKATCAIANRLLDPKDGVFSAKGPVKKFNLEWRDSKMTLKENLADYDTKFASLMTTEANRHTKEGTAARVHVLRDKDDVYTLVLSVGTKNVIDGYHEELKKFPDVAMVHSDDSVSVLSFDAVLDNGGFIIGLIPKEKSELAMMELSEQILEHIGVKGMHWGVRKSVGDFMSDPKYQPAIAVGSQIAKSVIITAGVFAIASIAGPIVASGAGAAARALTGSMGNPNVDNSVPRPKPPIAA